MNYRQTPVSQMTMARDDGTLHYLRRREERRVFRYTQEDNRSIWTVPGRDFGCCASGMVELGWRYDGAVEDVE